MNLEPEQLNSALIGFFGTVLSIVATVVGYFIRRMLTNLDERFKSIEEKLEIQEQVNNKQTFDIQGLTTSAKISERMESTMQSEIKEIKMDVKKLNNNLMSNILPLLKK